MGRRDRRFSSPYSDIETLLRASVQRTGRDARRAMDQLARLGWPAVSAALAQLLVTEVSSCWQNGWQPADLVHLVGRDMRALHRRICADAVALDALSYRHVAGADPGWLAQVDAVRSRRGTTDPTRVLDQWTKAAGGDRTTALDAALLILTMMRLFPPVPRLVPPPSEWEQKPRLRPDPSGSEPEPSSGPGRVRAADPKMIDRVRALLAKAESTEFPDEAETFTAKAQELIARHAIDLAMLRGTGSSSEAGGGGAVGRRILIDDPYSRAKSILVSVVGNANRCRAVFTERLGFSTVFGTPSDLDAVELLFTSLLTQGTAAMAAAGRVGGARSRARAFRQSFWVAFAYRIGERLEAATSSAVDEAVERHGGENVLPVLARCDEAAEAARDEAYPQVRARRIAASSHEGWLAGRTAADLARLGPDGQLRAG